MSANISINQNTGKAEIFSTVMPWHGLGQVVAGAQTWADAMSLASLDWNVEKRQLADPTTGTLVDAYGTFRADTNAMLGIFKEGYKIIQNRYAFDFIDALLEAENGAHYESAGALDGGRRVWAMASLPHDIRIGLTDDVTKTFLLFATSHDGSLGATCKLTSVRVVCNNTLSAALSQKSTGAVVKVKHTKSAEVRLEEARALMADAKHSVYTLAEKLNELAHRKVNSATALAVMDRVFGDKWRETTRSQNRVAKIAELFESNDDNAIPEVRGTAYNLLNAFTQYTDHFATVRKTNTCVGMTEAQVRTKSAMFGGGDDFKVDALNAILDVTAGAPRHELAAVSVGSGSGSDESIDDVLRSLNI